MKKYIKIIIIMLCLTLINNVFASSLNQSSLLNNFTLVLDNENCKVFGEFAKDINGAFDLFKIIAPLLVIVTSIFDFIKAFTGKVEGEMNKAFKKLLMRFIFAIVLFFLPTILDFFLSLVDSSYSTCIN